MTKSLITVVETDLTMIELYI